MAPAARSADRPTSLISKRRPNGGSGLLPLLSGPLPELHQLRETTAGAAAALSGRLTLAEERGMYCRNLIEKFLAVCRGLLIGSPVSSGFRAGGF